MDNISEIVIYLKSIPTEIRWFIGFFFLVGIICAFSEILCYMLRGDPDAPCWCGGGLKYRCCHMMEDIKRKKQ